MERPSSRGGQALASSGVAKAPTGSSIAQPERPSSAMRVSTSMGRPGTSTRTSMAGPPSLAGSSIAGSIAGSIAASIASGPPPGTAIKRQGNGAGPPGTAAGRAGIQVENRPITQHGVTGLKTASPGQGRQILDRNYFLNELRQKRQEIMAAISQMQDEITNYDQKSKQFSLMDKRLADLNKDVKVLQETLTDYNMVLDKIGSHTPIAAINAQYLALKEQNNSQQKRVDGILTERLNVEQRKKQAEGKIADIQQSIEAKLNTLPPSQRQQWLDLQAERNQLIAESTRVEETLNELDKSLAAAEGELARNAVKQKALQLQEQIKQLTEKKYELAAEEEKSRASPEEQRETLLSKIKRDNAEIDRITVQIKEVQEQIKKVEGRMGGTGGGSVGGGGAAPAVDDPASRQKFEELIAKEKEMSMFMDSFPSRRAEKQTERTAREDAIVAALERVAKLQSISKASLPNKKTYQEMQDELDYKKVQLENTASTQEQLKDQLAQRRAELDRVNTLEEHLQQEMPRLAEKQQQLKQEMQQFEQVADVKKKAEERKLQLESQRAALIRRKDLLKVTVAEKGWKHQAKKAQLQESGLYIALEKLEQKLRSQQQTIYQTADFVKTKESETNYQGLVSNISSLVEELNNIAIRAVATV